MTNLWLRLNRHNWLHRAVGPLRIYWLASRILSWFPLYRRRSPTGPVYRLTSPDQFAVEFEIFDSRCYAIGLGDSVVHTFADLGCNAGWFPLWLRAEMPQVDLSGLLIDANPRMVAEALWHLRRNGMSDCHVAHGAVGLPLSAQQVVFHVNPSSAGSSLQPHSHLNHPLKGPVRDIRVPVISLEHEWTKVFHASSIDILKIDIEGAELGLLRNEAQFIGSHVRSVVLEWHSWAVAPADIERQMNEIGFKRVATSCDDGLTGVVAYIRS